MQSPQPVLRGFFARPPCHSSRERRRRIPEQLRNWGRRTARSLGMQVRERGRGPLDGHHPSPSVPSVSLTTSGTIPCARAWALSTEPRGRRRRAHSCPGAEPARESASALAFESPSRLPCPRQRSTLTCVRRVWRGIRKESVANPRERPKPCGPFPHDALRVHLAEARQNPYGVARTAGTSDTDHRAAAPTRSRNHRRIEWRASWGCPFGALTTTSEFHRSKVSAIRPPRSRAAAPASA